MLESTGIRWIYHGLSTFALSVELLWIYLLQFRSPPEMKVYRWVLIKLAWLEFVFAAILGLFMCPDVLFPAPCAAAFGFVSSWGHDAAVHTLFLVFITAWSTFMSVNDCLHVRNFFIHENDKMIKLIFTWYIGLPAISVGLLITGGPLGLAYYKSIMDPELFLAQMRASGNYKYVEYYVEHGITLVAMDQESWWTILFGGLVILGLVVCYALNMISALVMMKKLNGMRSHMSAQTYKAHQSILRMLFVQNIYPALVLVIPCSLALLAFLTKDWSLVGSNLFKHWVFVGFYLFPVISFSCSIFYMKPYREFLVSLFRKKPEVVRVASISATDDGLTASASVAIENNKK